MVHATMLLLFLTVNGKHTQLPSFTKLTDSSLSKINCTDHEIETTVDVFNTNKASGDDGINHKILDGVSKSVSKLLCTCILKKDPLMREYTLIIGRLQTLFASLKREIMLNYPNTDKLHY